jgi:F0F1-type ATP synthase assembly protein I
MRCRSSAKPVRQSLWSAIMQDMFDISPFSIAIAIAVGIPIGIFIDSIVAGIGIGLAVVIAMGFVRARSRPPREDPQPRE